MLRTAAIKTSKSVLAWVLLASVVTGPTLVHSREPMPAQGSATIAVAQLPESGRETYRLIRQGGPFPYDKDGSVFGNRERLLPAQARGYYREYTVSTPGVRHRGARRIVCGGQPRTPTACYYTADHYASFRRIVE
ncbi:ribonuclease domain-containing protein [Variovorax sp. VNK109]|jgi:ribonuclease T1|uniref:ribonuclease domain-containing protein n=1 Tax=Variovorax sp. VNK109 TaxID=3400919 RepID=UPI003C02E112